MNKKVTETALRAAYFWPTLGRFPGIWRIFSSFGDSELNSDGLGFQWNGQRKNIWTLNFELLDRNIALLHFKTERVAETALRESFFWQTSAPFPATWGIFWCPRDCKQSADVAWFAVKWTQQKFLNFHFVASGPKCSPSSLLEWKSSRDRLTRIVILTKFGSISPNLGDSFPVPRSLN